MLHTLLNDCCLSVCLVQSNPTLPYPTISTSDSRSSSHSLCQAAEEKGNLGNCIDEILVVVVLFGSTAKAAVCQSRFVCAKKKLHSLLLGRTKNCQVDELVEGALLFKGYVQMFRITQINAWKRVTIDLLKSEK